MTLNNVMDLVNLNAVNEEEVQQVVFWIEEEEFSVDITDIQEIIKYTAPVKVPKSPDYIIGIINFRGHVIPVIDLRIIFNFPKIEINNYPIIVVVEVEEKIFGLLVDKVTDIVTLTNEETEPPPNFSNSKKAKYIRSIAKINNRMIFMLDLEKLINGDPVEKNALVEPKTGKSSNKDKKQTTNAKKSSGEKKKK